MFLVLTALWMLSVANIMVLRKATLMSFFSCLNIIFVLQVFPKMVAFQFWGLDAFLPSGVSYTSSGVTTGTLLVFLFILTINLCYVTNPTNVMVKYKSQQIQLWDTRTESVARFTIFGLLFPLFGAALAFYLSEVSFTLQTLIAKREFNVDGSISPAYIAQKLAQISKSAFYLSCLGYVCSPNKKRWFRTMFLMATLTSIVYITSSQRSGILILFLEILLTLLIGKTLRMRTLAIFGGIFIALSAMILLSRFSEGTGSLSLFELIFRRYFFDLEKITAIYQFSQGNHTGTSPVMGLFQLSSAPWPDDNIHYYISEHVFGMPNNGVPPSILGEIILLLGTVFIIPITVLIVSLIIMTENRMMRTHKGPLKILYIIILSKAYFLLPNSDLLSTVKRIAFDITLFYIGMFAFRMTYTYFAKTQPLRRPIRPSAPAHMLHHTS